MESAEYKITQVYLVRDRYSLLGSCGTIVEATELIRIAEEEREGRRLERREKESKRESQTTEKL